LTVQSPGFDADIACVIIPARILALGIAAVALACAGMSLVLLLAATR
jgi:hypothetical protein